MFIIKPEIFEIQGFNPDCYWLLSKSLAKRMNNETRTCFPSLEKICEDCAQFNLKTQKLENWSKKKVVEVINTLIKIGLITKSQTLRSSGGFKNTYQIVTDLIQVTVKLKIDGELKTDEEISNKPQFRNGTMHSSEMDKPQFRNGTLTRASSELNTTTSSKKIETGESELTCEYDVDNPTQPDFDAELDPVGTPAIDFTQTWEPNPTYHQATQRACPDMTQPDFDAELIKFRLFYAGDWPKHPDKTWLSWCQRANGEYRERKQWRIHSDQNSKLAQTLAEQRVRDFDTKKKQNIDKVGTQNRKKQIFKPYYRDYSSREEYEQAILDAREQGMIVETEILPTNAKKFWGESPGKYELFKTNYSN